MIRLSAPMPMQRRQREAAAAPSAPRTLVPDSAWTYRVCMGWWMYLQAYYIRMCVHVSFACPPGCVQMDHGYVGTLGFRPRSESAAKGRVADVLSPSLVADGSKAETPCILSRSRALWRTHMSKSQGPHRYRCQQSLGKRNGSARPFAGADALVFARVMLAPNLPKGRSQLLLQATVAPLPSPCSLLQPSSTYPHTSSMPNCSAGRTRPMSGQSARQKAPRSSTTQRCMSLPCCSSSL